MIDYHAIFVDVITMGIILNNPVKIDKTIKRKLHSWIHKVMYRYKSLCEHMCRLQKILPNLHTV